MKLGAPCVMHPHGMLPGVCRYRGTWLWPLQMVLAYRRNPRLVFTKSFYKNQSLIWKDSKPPFNNPHLVLKWDFISKFLQKWALYFKRKRKFRFYCKSNLKSCFQNGQLFFSQNLWKRKISLFQNNLYEKRIFKTFPKTILRKW